MTDAQLIKLSIHGDDAAFKALVQKYESMVAATIIGMLGPGHEAEDVGQETFIRFFKSLDRYRGEASVSTYLTRIAINLSLNAIRRRKRHHLRFWQNSEGQKTELIDTDIQEYDGTQEMVHTAIQQLKSEFRSVIVLRFLKGHSIKEIAEILNIPQGTVLSRMARAQKKLKVILQPLMGDDYVPRNGQSAAQIV